MKTISLFLLLAACEWKSPPPATPKPNPEPPPTEEPPEPWCQTACARWQAMGCKEGFDVCDAFGADGECSRMVSCLSACEAEPNAYPAGPCVANPPAGSGPMQTCEQIYNTCNR